MIGDGRHNVLDGTNRAQKGEDSVDVIVGRVTSKLDRKDVKDVATQLFHAIQSRAGSTVDRFSSVDEGEESKQGIELVCYGIGTFARREMTISKQ